MDKQKFVNPHNGILFSNKKEWTTRMCYNMDKPQKYYFTRRKPDAKDYILHYSIYMKWAPQTNLQACKGDQWWPRARESETRVPTNEFWVNFLK